MAAPGQKDSTLLHSFWLKLLPVINLDNMVRGLSSHLTPSQKAMLLSGPTVSFYQSMLVKDDSISGQKSVFTLFLLLSTSKSKTEEDRACRGAQEEREHRIHQTHQISIYSAPKAPHVLLLLSTVA